jgi:hypothetical protein
MSSFLFVLSFVYPRFCGVSLDTGWLNESGKPHLACIISLGEYETFGSRAGEKGRKQKEGKN